jgi:hypothetical protein
MYALVRSLTLRDLLIEQLPVLLISMIIAEFFYKFHSFTLETVAFLVTWFVLDWIVQFLRRQVSKTAADGRR